jgi:serine/threonine protein kinase
MDETDVLAGRFQPYRVKKLLGEGGMGVVYLAERPDLGSLVAIKILRDGWLSPARRRRFESEQRTLAQLNHPGIARLYDAQTLSDGTPWFVMEYVDGVPPTEYCRARNSSVEERLRLFRAICEAVQHAHEHGIIHRDLKPSNILVKEDGSVRLLDFGIASALDPDEAVSDGTLTTIRLITPAYSAPEHLRGERAGVHTDVYSLGVILHELLTGELPTTCRPGPVLRIRQTDLDVLCSTALHADPARRYPSVVALIADIDHFLRLEPLDARSDSIAYTTRMFLRRHRRSVAASFVFLVVAGGVGLAAARFLRPESHATAPSDAAATSVTATRPRNEEAYDLYLRYGGGKYDPGPENTRSIAMLERAVALDPSYAPAWLALSRRLYVESRYVTGSREQFDRAMVAIQKAVDLDPGFVSAAARLAQNQIEVGTVTALSDGYREITQLLRRWPDDAQSHFSLSLVLRYAGLLEEAGRECGAAVSLDPGKAAWRTCAVVYLAQGRYDEAMPYIQLDNSGSEISKALTVHALVSAGREAEALRIGRPNLPQWKSLDMLLACVARKPSSEIATLAAAVQPHPDAETNYYSAAHLAYCRQDRAAIEMLRRAIDAAYCSYPHVDTDPFFARLRGTPEFASLRAAAIACQKEFLKSR